MLPPLMYVMIVRTFGSINSLVNLGHARCLSLLPFSSKLLYLSLLAEALLYASLHYIILYHFS